MKKVSYELSNDILSDVIHRLTNAVNVCYQSPEVENLGYPYATGYSRSAMQRAIMDLKRVVKELEAECDN